MSATVPVHISEAEASQLLGISMATLRKWRCHGRGPRFRRIGGTAVRYPLDALKAFIESSPEGGGNTGSKERSQRKRKG